LVKRGATVRANATIICGATIGPYAMVAAGAVVTRDVAPFSLVVGAPARFRAWVGRSGEQLSDDLICPRTGERYAIVGGQLAPEDEKPYPVDIRCADRMRVRPQPDRRGTRMSLTAVARNGACDTALLIQRIERRESLVGVIGMG